MVAKKLLLEDDITACVKQICLLAVICKVSNRKTLSGEIFCLFEKRLLLTFKFVLRETYCLFVFFFYQLLIGLQPTFLKCIVILM